MCSKRRIISKGNYDKLTFFIITAFFSIINDEDIYLSKKEKHFLIIVEIIPKQFKKRVLTIQ